MFKVFVGINKVKKISSVVLQRQNIVKYFVDLSRHVHESSNTDPVKNPSNDEESCSKREKHQFNGKAIMDLCLEKFDDDLLYFPEILNKDEWISLIDWGKQVEDTMRSIRYDEILLNDKIPDNVYNKLKELKLFGKQIPKKYGGLELTNTENSYIQEILGMNPSIARLLAENEEMGIKALVKYGTEEQKEKYLPKLAKGESMISFAYMEQSSSLMDFKSYMGLEASHVENKFILQGRKKWVYNATNADIFLVLGSEAVLHNQDKMIVNTVFIVDKGTEGLRIVPPMKKYWFRGLDICEVVFDEVIVTNENILGGYGKGTELFQDIVKTNRTSVLAECTTGLKRLYHDALDKSKSNLLFGKPISDFQYCEYALGELACLSYAVESVTYYLASRADYYEDPDLTMEVFMAKIFATEVTQEALQIYFNLLGKNGYKKESFVEELILNSHYYSIIDDSGFDLKIYVMSHIACYLARQLSTTIKQLADPKNNLLAVITHNLRMKPHEYDGGTPKLDLSLCVHRHTSFCADDLEYILSRLKYISNEKMHSFGNQILKHDYDLIAMCDMLIWTYALIACIARASKAGFLNLPDAVNESKLVLLFSTRTVTKIKALSYLIGTNQEEFEMYAEIGRKAIHSKEYMIEHPLMRNF